MVYLRLSFEWWLSHTEAVLWLCRGIIWAQPDGSRAAQSSFLVLCVVLPILGFSSNKTVIFFLPTRNYKHKTYYSRQSGNWHLPICRRVLDSNREFLEDKAWGCSQEQQAGASSPVFAWGSSKVAFCTLWSEMVTGKGIPLNRWTCNLLQSWARAWGDPFCSSLVMPSGGDGRRAVNMAVLGGYRHLWAGFAADVLQWGSWGHTQPSMQELELISDKGAVPALPTWSCI